jgi:hypothetical protein
MKKFFLTIAGLLILAVAAFVIFYKAESQPKPMIPAPADPQAASELQAAIDASYCEDAQQVLAQTTIPVSNDIHLNFENFVKSKPSADPVTTHQFLHYLPVVIDNRERPFPAIVSCKLKTAERLNDRHAEADAGPDLSCRHLLERDVNLQLSNLDKESLVFAPEDILFAEDEMANQGRTWLAPWPYAVARIEAGKLIWQSKAMLINYSRWFPMPARFLGTHYCHLPTPQYIRGVLVGDIETLLEPVSLPDNK